MIDSIFAQDADKNEALNTQRERMFVEEELKINLLSNPTKKNPLTLAEIVGKYQSFIGGMKQEESHLKSRFTLYGIAGYELVSVKAVNKDTRYFLRKKDY